MTFSTILVLVGLVYWFVVYGTDIYHKYVTSRKMLSPALRSVLITGCDSGFGNITAKKMTEMGMQVFAGCLTQEAADTLAKESPNTISFQMDVTKKDDIQKAFVLVSSKINDKEGLWALINNAGIGHSAPFDWQEVSDVERVLNVNYMSGLHVLKTFLPLIKKARGRVVGVASVLGFMPCYGAAGYCGSKHAVEGFYGSLRLEMQPFGVAVSLIEPGAFKTLILSTAKTVARKFWETSPSQIREQYGAEFAEKFVADLDKGFQLGSDPTEVRDAMIAATLSESPRAHYPVGRDMYLWNNLLRWWPARSQDMFFRVLRKTPPLKAAAGK